MLDSWLACQHSKSGTGEYSTALHGMALSAVQQSTALPFPAAAALRRWGFWMHSDSNKARGTVVTLAYHAGQQCAVSSCLEHNRRSPPFRHVSP
jgi:hypothetical protein